MHVEVYDGRAAYEPVAPEHADGDEVEVYSHGGTFIVDQNAALQAAVLGLAGLNNRPGNERFEHSARTLSIPILFLFQWDDELMSRQSGLDLFDAIGSKDKAMHIFPGGHVQTPLWERDAYEAHFVRHLGR